MAREGFVRLAPYLAGLCLLAASASAKPPALLGTVVPPYPGGFTQSEGACVGNGDVLHKCDHSVAVLSDARGKPAWILATHFKTYDDLEKPHSLVTDVLAYPPTDKNRMLVLWTCLFKGEPDASVLAIVNNPGEEAKGASGWAYRVDVSTGKFAKLNPADVACYEPQGDE